MFIARRLAGKAAVCGFKVGAFALMGVIISQSKEESQLGERGN
jgi:hypothetical protein